MNLNNRMLNIDKKTIKKNKKRKKQIKNRFFHKKTFFIEIKNQKIKNGFLYNTIRRAAYCRLSFFNGRRSKEISCLSIKQWHLAKKNYYLTPQQNKFLENAKSCFLL